MDTKNVKILGGLGSLFIVLSAVPYIGWILMVVGLILLIIALKKVSDVYPEKNILKNFIIGMAIIFVGGFIAGLVGVLAMIPFISSGDNQSFGMGIGLGTILMLILVYVSTVIGAYFLKNTFVALFEITKQDIFRLGGLFILFSGVLLQV